MEARRGLLRVAKPDAQRFYRREGYREIPPFGNYVGSALPICYQRELR